MPSPQSQSFSQSYGSILPTFLAYIVPSTRGYSPWRPDAVMSTTGRGRHLVLQIFKGRRECTEHYATYDALPAAGPYLRLSRFQAAPPRLVPKVLQQLPCPLTHRGLALVPTVGTRTRAPAILRETLEGTSYLKVQLVFRPYTQVRRTICTLVSLWASTRVFSGFTCSGIVDYLLGPERYAHTRTLLRRSRSVGGAQGGADNLSGKIDLL
ncbi:hypothetical protein T459_23397 [Capsicum annuum]|uniref:Uncharacterized protein n=1 Tax=Capsicum annuum TaxID=4072 RepID=A0A2G2YS95_CAPAN|nr:hypothetical protein T459_23397 [Capsicum annuum]